jgi:hypothetical protein
MSEKRQQANAQNALRSSGPKTQAGKARSRLNAKKHGAYAKICLEGEDITRFKSLQLDLLAEYRPEGFEERLIVQEIAEIIWRKNRFKAAEGLTLNAYTFYKSGQVHERGNVGLAMAQDAANYATIPRCLAAEDLLDRRLWTMFDRLRKLQKRRGFRPWKSLANTTGQHASTIEQLVPESGAPTGITHGHNPLEANGQVETTHG